MTLANATSVSTAPAIGFISSKITNTQCIVTYAGELGGFSSLTPGFIYYLDVSAGGITTTPPATSGNVVQIVGIAGSATVLTIIPINYSIVP